MCGDMKIEYASLLCQSNESRNINHYQGAIRK